MAPTITHAGTPPESTPETGVGLAHEQYGDGRHVFTITTPANASPQWAECLAGQLEAFVVAHVPGARDTSYEFIGPFRFDTVTDADGRRVAGALTCPSCGGHGLQWLESRSHWYPDLAVTRTNHDHRDEHRDDRRDDGDTAGWSLAIDTAGHRYGEEAATADIECVTCGFTFVGAHDLPHVWR